MANRSPETYGRTARNRLAEASAAGPEGARAAVETFYHAFNQRSPDLLSDVWIDDPLVRLNNPLGGMIDGRAGISQLYSRIFTGPARVWVELHDVVEYDLGDSGFVFAGRERGEFTRSGVVVPLEIRTTRVLARVRGRWGQVHHHGSITDTALLERYRSAVAGS